MKITRKTQINEVIRNSPELAEEFFNAGMMCIGCPMSAGETIEQGCLGHGMSNKQIDNLIEKLNKKSVKKQIKKSIKKR
jgi:hybrid cluster-associated redox disulfide protein